MNATSRRKWYTCATMAFAVALLVLLSTATLASAKKSSGLLKVSSDPFTNSTSQHKTQLEPDTYSAGSTIVSVFQSGRFYDGGSSDNGWATSTDNGATWHNGFFPGTTVYATPPGKYDRISDPSVSYDAKHNTWVAAGLALIGANGAAVLVNQSADGLTWQNAVTVATTNGFYDKDWIVCDDNASSPHYGNCYVEWDDAANGDSVLMSTSSDGGATWSAPSHPANAYGLGGQPLVQPNGNVVVPFWGNGIQSFTSTNGGKSWGSPVTISNITEHHIGGGMRANDPLPSAEIDGAGTVYVAWNDCRFEKSCSANDIVYSTSSDGTHWSKVQRVPADPVGSNVDHFIPGIAVDKSTSGSSAHIALTYYFFPNASCSSNCQLEVGYLSSTNAGSTWSSSVKLAGPMNPTWLASTNQGYMVGDYISTSIVGNGMAYSVFAVAKKNKGQKFNEAMFTPKGGLPVASGTLASSSQVLYTGPALAPAHLTAN